jgi:hypothetical protein
MARTDFIAHSDDAFAAQLQNFQETIKSYEGVLGVLPAQVTAQEADADYFSYVVACQQIMKNGARQWTEWKDITRGGGDVPATGEGLVPAFPSKVTAVEPGIEPRFRAFAKAIKASPNYNVSIGEALGIEGAEQTGPDMATVQPVISVGASGTEVQVKWGWGGYSEFLDMCEIQVDRGGGAGFVPLCFDTTPNYTDTTPFPATPAKWSYRAIYRVGDHRVGQWSNPVGLTVGG